MQDERRETREDGKVWKAPRQAGGREKKRIPAEECGGRGGWWRRQGYEKRRRATREVLREGHGWTESSGRENRRETRDKETNIDNEKTSMAKKGGTKEVRKDEIEKEV